MEAAQLDPHQVGLRDSQNPDSVVLSLTAHAWTTLLQTTR